MATHLGDIKDVLLQALKKANSSISVAVACFSDKDLIEAITEKQRMGVSVRVLVTQTEQLDLLLFEEFLANGGEQLVANKDTGVMHVNLVIIDQMVVFTGSFHWTYAASRHNDELVIESTDKTQIVSLQSYFEDLWAMYSTDEEGGLADLPVVLTKLDLVKSYANLGQWAKASSYLDEVLTTCTVLDKDSQDLLQDLRHAVRRQERLAVQQVVGQLHKMHQQLNPYQSSEEALLKIHIRWMQQQIRLLTALYAEQADVIEAWDRKILRYANDLLVKLYALKTALAKIRMEASQKKETKQAYQQAQDEQKAFEEQHAATQKDEQKLDEDGEKRLRELYRKATGLCHPDKADQSSPDSVKQATAYMVAVNQAYSAKDIKALERLLEELTDGASLHHANLHPNSDQRVQQLKASLALLQNEYEAQLQAVHAQSQHQSFINASTCEDFDEWIKGFRQKLEKEITTLEKAIARFS